MSVKGMYQQLLLWVGFLSLLLFSRKMKGREAGSLFLSHSLLCCQDTESLGLHRKEMTFYKVTSAIHMTTHFVVSVSQRRSEEPSKKLKLTVPWTCIGRLGGGQPPSYLLWHFPFSAHAWVLGHQKYVPSQCWQSMDMYSEDQVHC